MPAVSKAAMLKNRILARLPERESKRLLPHLRFVSLGLSQVLYRPEEPIRYVYFPLDAVVSMVAPLNDGKNVEVTLVGPEGMLGVRAILEGKTYWYISVVQIEGGCLRISAKVLRAQFKRGDAFQARLLQYTSYLLVQTAQLAACNRVHRLRERLARWLLMTHDRAKHDEFPMTHEFLSEMLGTPRSEVSAAAGALRRSGVIGYKRGRMAILDRKALEALACECYQVLRDALEEFPARGRSVESTGGGL
jgi:CRP-like cAMP-binding protein